MNTNKGPDSSRIGNLLEKIECDPDFWAFVPIEQVREFLGEASSETQNSQAVSELIDTVSKPAAPATWNWQEKLQAWFLDLFSNPFVPVSAQMSDDESESTATIDVPSEVQAACPWVQSLRIHKSSEGALTIEAVGTESDKSTPALKVWVVEESGPTAIITDDSRIGLLGICEAEPRIGLAIVPEATRR